jgi:hypothetical protein
MPGDSTQRRLTPARLEVYRLMGRGGQAGAWTTESAFNIGATSPNNGPSLRIMNMALRRRYPLDSSTNLEQPRKKVHQSTRYF